MMITSPEMGSAPQLEYPTQCWGKGPVKRQMMGAHQSPLAPPSTPNLCTPLPPAAIPTRVCQDELEKGSAEK